MSELGAIFGGGADHAHKQAELEKILPAPAPIAAGLNRDDADDTGVVIPEIGLPGAAIAYEPFRLKNPDEESDETE